MQLVSSTVVGEAANAWLTLGQALAPFPVALTSTTAVDDPSLTVTVPLLKAGELLVLRIDRMLPVTLVERLEVLGVAV